MFSQENQEIDTFMFQKNFTIILLLCYTYYICGIVLGHLITVVSHSVVSNSLLSFGLYLPDSSVHGILQARILKRVAIPSSRGSSWLRDQTRVSRITGKFFTVWVTKEALIILQSKCFPQESLSSGMQLLLATTIFSARTQL